MDNFFLFNIFIQIWILIILLVRTYHNKNIIGYFYLIVYFLLIVIQEIWMYDFFDNGTNSKIELVYHELLYTSYIKSVVYVTFSLLIIFIIDSLFKKKLKISNLKTINSNNINVYIFFLIIFIIITINYGGIYGMILMPGQNLDPGLTMFLMLLGIGRFPLYEALLNKRKTNFYKSLAFFLVFLIYILNSRFLAVFIILELITVLLKMRLLSLYRFFYLNFLILSIVILFGLYRNFTSDTNSEEYILTYIYEYFFSGELLNWLYYSNIEAFIGLAGIVSYDDIYGINFDYGLSHLSYIFKLVPYFIRDLFSDEVKYLDNLYPYNRSIISSGLENAYAAFGLFGIVLFSIFISFLYNYSNSKINSNSNFLILYIVLPISMLHLLRGLIGGTLLLCFVQFLLIRLYYFLLIKKP